MEVKVMLRKQVDLHVIESRKKNIDCHSLSSMQSECAALSLSMMLRSAFDQFNMIRLICISIIPIECITPRVLYYFDYELEYSFDRPVVPSTILSFGGLGMLASVSSVASLSIVSSRSSSGAALSDRSSHAMATGSLTGDLPNLCVNRTTASAAFDLACTRNGVTRNGVGDL